MTWSRKGLFTSRETMRLQKGRAWDGREEYRYGDKKGRALRAYWITSGVAIVLCLSVIIGGACDASPNSTLNRWASGLADRIISISLRGFSDSVPTQKEESSEDLAEQDSTHSSQSKPIGSAPGNSSQSTRPPLTLESLYQFDYLAVPSGETPIVPMDLSLKHYGSCYIHNETGLTPDLEELLSRPLKASGGLEYMSASQAPKVLIVHTHGTEAYCEDGAVSYRDNGGEIARSNDPSESVVAVGRVISEELNRLGIPSIHCTVLHDREQYRNAYARAEETIQKYLERYPTIQLVIDVHRDSVVKSTGELIRPVTLYEGNAAAQVMCVVGSDWGGEENPNWERNLALALKFREKMNETCQGSCRPAYLKAATYNQELAPYSLLLEIGSAGNSLQEAIRSAYLVAASLADLWGEM